MRLVKEKVTLIVINHEETGQLARQHRRAMGMTLEEVGKAMNLSVSYLSALERGARAWTEDLMDRFNIAMGFKR
jgi:transcriptional regulator with XRE-family HTH domain